jgi:hypothetical protein
VQIGRMVEQFWRYVRAATAVDVLALMFRDLEPSD